MRRLTAVLALLTLCCTKAALPPPPEPAPEQLFAVDELRFMDHDLSEIAQEIVRNAKARGITTASGRTKIEALLALEAQLGTSTRAMECFNEILAGALSSDKSRWSSVRRRAARRFRGEDAASLRVRQLLDTWERHKFDVVASDASDPARWYLYDEGRWESEFHQLVRSRPPFAATWGWLLAGEYAREVERLCGRNDPQHAYEYYLATTGFGSAREARDLFSVPGIQIADAPR